MSKEQALEELLKMIKEGNITDYDAELASYRDENGMNSYIVTFCFYEEYPR
jgi:hypothetical protein